MIVNYNSGVAKRIDDGGRSKCVGFVQTLLENFTGHGDIVIDFAGGWGATLLAAHNCSRCCIAAETRDEALRSMQQIVKLKSATKSAGTTSTDHTQATQATISKGKKPLTEEDDLGSLLEDENRNTEEHSDILGSQYEQNVQGFSWGTPDQGFSLPTYAEGVAQALQNLPPTPLARSRDVSPRRHPFIDDEAEVGTVGLGSETNVLLARSHFNGFETLLKLFFLRLVREAWYDHALVAAVPVNRGGDALIGSQLEGVDYAQNPVASSAEGKDLHATLLELREEFAHSSQLGGANWSEVIRGCDGSVLLNSTDTNSAEGEAHVNFGLRGLNEVDEIKAALEFACPGCHALTFSFSLLVRLHPL
ncbi:hypothetical protein R1sor_024501 [Riccia sorocarpa]|uniref:Plant heme peroxidase family profile domain-containing protein n=1 Tax=Riccia sorocarpa TaxID=122646 RepID=A0ABD3GTV6_9MARC